MEMPTSTLPFAVVPTASAASGNNMNGQIKGSNSALFSKVLNSQINTSDTSASTPSQPIGIVEQLVNGMASLTGSSDAPLISQDELLQQLEQLLNKLDETIASQEETALSEEELAEMLQHGNALMTLLGLPNPTITVQGQEATSGNGAEESGNAIAKGTVIIQLQDTLLNLQSALQQGEMKAVKLQDPLPFIANFVQKLEELLANKASAAVKSTNVVSSDDLPDWVMAKPAGDETNKHLDKLHQQSNRVLAVTEQPVVSTSQTTAAVNTPDENSALPFNHLVQTRAVPLAAANQAGTTFVFADKFAETMTGMIVQRFSIASFNGISEAKLKLYPEQLGQVDVRITMQNGQLTAVFQTDTSMAKEMLDNQMAQLRAALQAQGLNVDKLNVNFEQSPTLEFDQQQEKQGGGQFTNHDDDADNSRGEASFESELIEQVVIQQLGFGRAVNETV